MTYDKETAHREIREAISDWLLDLTLPKPEIEVRRITGVWLDASLAYFLTYSTAFDYRLKPKPIPMIRVNGIEVPAPETVALKFGDAFFVPDSNKLSKHFESYKWTGDSFDLKSLACGLVYLTPENAIARTKAMLQFEVVV
jgi:hypothetical protein